MQLYHYMLNFILVKQEHQSIKSYSNTETVIICSLLPYAL